MYIIYKIIIAPLKYFLCYTNLKLITFLKMYYYHLNRSLLENIDDELKLRYEPIFF